MVSKIQDFNALAYKDNNMTLFVIVLPRHNLMNVGNMRELLSHKFQLISFQIP